MPTIPTAIEVMGVRVTPFASYNEAVSCVGRFLESGAQSLWVAINPQKIYRAWHEPELMELLQRCDAGIIDGVGVSLASKVLHNRMLPRCTGCDLFFELIEASAHNGWKVFLLGASPESNAAAAENLQRRWPGLSIVGRRDGFFSDDQEVIEQINRSGADLLFVAMGSPRQEYWLDKHRHALRPRFLLGVGGSLDVASGANPRAPMIFRKTGTEFLYQLFKQPWRWRRQIIYTPFMLKVLGARIAGRRRKRIRSAGHAAKAQGG